MKIRPMGAELFHAGGRTDRHDDTNSRFSQFYWMRLKIAQLRNTSLHDKGNDFKIIHASCSKRIQQRQYH